MPTDQELPLPPGTPDEVVERAKLPSRVPTFDPTLGVPVEPATRGVPRNRLVAIGDSLSQGFQSGAIYNTDLSYPAIIAAEVGWTGYRYPRYGGPGGLPLNIELLVRQLAD